MKKIKNLYLFISDKHSSYERYDYVSEEQFMNDLTRTLSVKIGNWDVRQMDFSQPVWTWEQIVAMAYGAVDGTLPRLEIGGASN